MTMSGLMGAPMEALKILLASTPAFQTFCGAESASEALGSVFVLFAVAAPEKTSRAIVTFMDGDFSASRSSASGGAGAFDIDSNLTLILESEVDREMSAGVAAAFADSVSAMVGGMMAASGVAAGAMYVRELAFKGFEFDDLAGQPVLRAVFRVGWGV